MSTEENNDTNAKDGEEIYFERHKAIPVLAEEIVKTSAVIKTHPNNTPSPKKAILPTGVAAGRVQYVGKVTETKRKRNDTGKAIRMKSDDNGRGVYMYAFNEDYSDYETAKQIDTGAYVSVTGSISVNEDNDFSHLNIENIKQVSQKTRVNFLANTADLVMDRIQALSNCNDAVSREEIEETTYAPSEDIEAKKEALKRYNYDFDRLARVVVRAVELADKNMQQLD